MTAALAGTPHVRLSTDGGRTYPARHARPLPAEPAGVQPCTVPVYDPGSASGRMLVLDLDPARGDVDHQAAELGQLLERLGARYVADVAPSRRPPRLRPVRRGAALARAARPRRAMALRFPAIDPAPMARPRRPDLASWLAGTRAAAGGCCLRPADDALAAVEHPNGPEVWAALLTEFAAELQQVEARSTCVTR